MKSSVLSAILVGFVVMLGVSGSAFAESFRLSVQGSVGTTAIEAGEPEVDYLDTDLPADSFGVGGALQLTAKALDGLWVGAYLDHKVSRFEVNGGDFDLSVSAVGLVTRIDVLEPIILQMSFGYSHGTATVVGSDQEQDMIGIQFQPWVGYQLDLIPELILMDVGVFLTYDGLNPKDEEVHESVLGTTLVYSSFGFGLQLHWSMF